MNNKKNTQQIINAGCACAMDRGIWFVHYVMPLLMFYSFKEEKITIVKNIPCSENMDMIGLYSMIRFFDNRLYLIAQNVKESYVYDINLETFYEIKVGNNSFIASCVNGQYIYALPVSGHVITRINMSNEDVEKQELNFNLEQINGVNCIDDRYMICASLNINGIYVYDIENQSCKQITIKKRKCSIAYADYIDNMYYGFDVETKTIIRFNERGIVDRESKCFDMVGALVTHTVDGKIVLDSNYSGDIFLLDKELEQEEKIETKIKKSALTSPYYKGVWLNYGDYTYDISKSCEIIVLSELDVKRIDLHVDENVWNEIISKYLEGKILHIENVFNENEVFSLDVFIKNI